MKNVLSKICKRIMKWRNPTLKESADMVGIVENMRCSEEELESLKRIIERIQEEIKDNTAN